MSKLYYPAIFHPESIGYSVSVPDLDGCFSQGETLGESLEMIQDAISLYLSDLTDIPCPSSPESIKTKSPDFIVVVPFDLSSKSKRDTRSVKKTLTIPAWLNEAAEASHINFSSLLQSALKKQLNIE